MSLNIDQMVQLDEITLISGDNSGAVATVKAGSTAAAAGDTSLVVALSPNSPLPSGSNNIGSVSQASGPWTQNLTQVGGSSIALGQAAMAASFPVTIASNQSALPVSQSGTWTTGRTWTLSSGTDSATVVQGTAASLSGKWPVQITDGVNTMPTMDVVGRAGFQKITDGTNTAAVKAASTAAVVGDPALVVAISPNNTVGVTQSTPPWVTKDQADGTTGSAVPSIAIQVAGTDGTNLRAIKTDTNGQAKVNLNDGNGNAITSRITGGTSRGLDVGIADGPQLDSYNRLRVANQDLVFGVTFANTVNTLIFNTAIVGSATLTSVTNQAAARLSTTTGATDSIIVQSKRYLRYNPGVSHQIMITGIIGAKKTNVRQRWGYFDANDGLFFEQTATDLAIVLRSSTSGSPVDTRTVQASWNLDKLDGTGTSGITLDTTKHNAYVIDFVWQGAGRVRFGIMSGQGIIYFHQILNANVNMAPFMRSPSRPGRIELTNLGATSGTTNMDIVCALSLRETLDKLLAPFSGSASRGASSVSVSTIKPLISLRPKATFNSITNRVPIVPQEATVITSAQSVLVQVYINATLTGASFVSAGTNSAAEYDISATAVSGGTLILETYIDNTGNGVLDLNKLSDNAILGLDIPGSVQDIITITATSLAGGTNTWAQIGWQEFQ